MNSGNDKLVLHFTTVRAAIEEYFNRRMLSCYHIKVTNCSLQFHSTFEFKKAQQESKRK